MISTVFAPAPMFAPSSPAASAPPQPALPAPAVSEARPGFLSSDGTAGNLQDKKANLIGAIGGDQVGPPQPKQTDFKDPDRDLPPGVGIGVGSPDGGSTPKISTPRIIEGGTDSPPVIYPGGDPAKSFPSDRTRIDGGPPPSP